MTNNNTVQQTTMARGHHPRRGAWRKDAYRYALLLPALIATAVFCYLPFAGIAIAFKDYDIIKGFGNSPWVGLENFRLLFSSPDMMRVVWRTMVYSFVIMFVSFPFPIILALMFNELRGKMFKRVSQTVMYLPHFLSMITVVGMFYSALSVNGPVNMLLKNVIGDSYIPKNILLDSNYFLSVIFSVNLWKELGWSSVIFMAAIMGVDKSLYESAAIDGCGRFAQVWHVTLPGIFGTIVILLVMQIGQIFNLSFELVYGFQNLYTQNATDVINTLIYRQGIVNGNYSVATAFGLAQGVVSITLVLIANTLSKRLFSISIW